MNLKELQNLHEAYLEVYKPILNEREESTISRASRKLVDVAVKQPLKRAIKKSVKTGLGAAKEVAKAPVRAVMKHGSEQPEGTKRRAVSDFLHKVRHATLSPKERKRREKEQDKKNKELEKFRRKRERARAAARRQHQRTRHLTGKYRNVGVGSRESVREKYDVYDIILTYLLEEEYASTIKEAEIIMINMDEELRNDILQEVFDSYAIQF
jgi:hypothetical protein